MRYVLIAAVAGVLSSPQTLEEAARREAERRKALGEQGIDGKVIECADPASLAPNGNLTIWATGPATPGKLRAAAAQPGIKGNDRFRTALQRLDREIRQAEDRLDLLRRRLESEIRAPPLSTRAVNKAAAEQKVRRDIDDLQLKLKRLQSERLDTYNAARKSGMLPGEIDGKGITP